VLRVRCGRGAGSWMECVSMSCCGRCGLTLLSPPPPPPPPPTTATSKTPITTTHTGPRCRCVAAAGWLGLEAATGSGRAQAESGQLPGRGAHVHDRAADVGRMLHLVPSTLPRLLLPFLAIVNRTCPPRVTLRQGWVVVGSDHRSIFFLGQTWPTLMSFCQARAAA
jgi:hypothetical protein